MSERTTRFIAALLDIVARSASGELEAWLAEEVILHTPRFRRPITDRSHVAIVLRGILSLVDNFHYERTWATQDDAIMEFKGSIGDVEVHGLDIFTLDARGKVRELTVFLRPTRALEAIGQVEEAYVRAELERKASRSTPVSS
jgi:hypothetical protein